MARCGRQRADMGADQEQFFALHNNISFLDLRAAGADGFYLPAFKRNAGLEALFDKIVVEGFFVFNDTHASILAVPVARTLRNA